MRVDKDESRVEVSDTHASRLAPHASTLELLHTVGRLKALPRQGWVDRGIPSPESVADHIYRSALMAWILGAVAGLDTSRLVKLALVHDLPEAEAGDATPYSQVLARGIDLEEAVRRWRELLTADEWTVDREAKREREARAMARIAALAPEGSSSELTDLWIDYAEERSPEARFLAQVDKVEALLQAVEYDRAGYDADVEGFLASAREAVGHPVLVDLLGEIEQEMGRLT